MIPTTGQPYITSAMPTKNVHVPRSFFRARKKLITWLVPIVNVMPIKNISCAVRGAGEAGEAGRGGRTAGHYRQRSSAYIPHCKQRLVEEHKHTQEREEHAERRQPEPNLCRQQPVREGTRVSARAAGAAQLLRCQARLRGLI
jgi:hypothetical protein